MIRAVLFDLDDTLCDAAPAFAAGRDAAFAQALVSLPGVTEMELRAAWDAAHVDLFRALNAGEMTMARVREERFRRVLALLGRSDDRLADHLNSILGQTQLDALRLFDDVAALAELRSKGLFLGVITNGAGDAHTDSQRTKAAHLNLPGKVDGFWVSDEMGYRKPDPRAFLPALQATGAAATECLYIGDSLETDIAGANAAGMRSALIQRRGRAPSRHAGYSAQPWRTIHSLWQTLDLLEDPGPQALSR